MKVTTKLNIIFLYIEYFYINDQRQNIIHYHAFIFKIYIVKVSWKWVFQNTSNFYKNKNEIKQNFDSNLKNIIISIS